MFICPMKHTLANMMAMRHAATVQCLYSAVPLQCGAAAVRFLYSAVPLQCGRGVQSVVLLRPNINIDGAPRPLQLGNYPNIEFYGISESFQFWLRQKIQGPAVEIAATAPDRPR